MTNTLTSDERSRLRDAGLNPISERFFPGEGLLQVEVTPSRKWRILSWPARMACKWRGFDGRKSGVKLVATGVAEDD